MNYALLLREYINTEDYLRKRAADLRVQAKSLPYAERDAVRRRITVMQEELGDVMLIRLELSRRRDEEREEMKLC
ncbi:MAG: hypothetical protein RSB36_03470 [Hydrogenoanaerobacterium sp.]